MENYWIDRKLKPGKDYPPELIRLTDYFNKKLEPFVKPISRRQQQKELQQIERIFNEFFFHQSKVLEFDRKHRDLAVVSASFNPRRLGLVTQRKKDYWQAFLKEHGKDPRGIINRCINKVNAKLKLTSPQLLLRDGTYYLEPIAVFSMRYLQRDKGAAIDLWELLAKIIDGVNPSLYKQCAYCKQVFFSRQRKKFHSECRSKYFSEKYGKEGRNSERQKQYRLRKKEKTKRLK
jgi:hypothetical protein